MYTDEAYTAAEPMRKCLNSHYIMIGEDSRFIVKENVRIKKTWRCLLRPQAINTWVSRPICCTYSWFSRWMEWIKNPIKDYESWRLGMNLGWDVCIIFKRCSPGPGTGSLLPFAGISKSEFVKLWIPILVEVFSGNEEPEQCDVIPPNPVLLHWVLSDEITTILYW